MAAAAAMAGLVQHRAAEEAAVALRKSTAEMIQLMHLLLVQYHEQSLVYLSCPFPGTPLKTLAPFEVDSDCLLEDSGFAGLF